MRWKLALVAVVLAVILCVPASAAITYLDPADPWGAEANLKDVYFQLYGVSYASSAALATAQRVSWERFDPAAFGTFESITLEAVWRNAAMEQNFGVYTGSGGSMSYWSPFFSVAGIGWSNPVPSNLRDPYYAGESFSHTFMPTESIGFYDAPRYYEYEQGLDGKWYWKLDGGGNPILNDSPWLMHSEAALNVALAAAPPMDQEVHMLILATPDPDVFLIAIEDLPYEHPDGHHDYNDFLVELRINREVIPEPASVVLLGLGITGMVIRRFRKTA